MMRAVFIVLALLACSAQAQAICMAHPDFREAHDARVEKRKPVFKDFSE